MRTILCIFGLCVLTAATVMAQGIGGGTGAPPVTCTGTKTKTDKCEDGKVPIGYFESFACEGVLPKGEGLVCKNAIAFAIDAFYCTAPELDPNVIPRSYTTFCYDRTTLVNCTIRRQCSPEVFYDPDGTQRSDCKLAQGGETQTTRYLKGMYSSATNPPGCTAAPINP
ncbi:MAG: hypothetical protein U0791_15425 [Gemmataceae bacterium]